MSIPSLEGQGWVCGHFGGGEIACGQDYPPRPTGTPPRRGRLLLFGWGNAAGHDADVFAAAPGGDGVDPGDSVAVA
jgi:hypothetical protein